ncbi:LysR family transcriptional regulator [Comamonas testosteroni]|uniref:LysR family transcriptional regulator n=1 Tax=Comamonas testosteroni TaxID=285 RepID=UPI0026F2EFED|nr:LysR family transcriptional regulator [Comamonas testosteroni]WQD42268.1 LysR family transcriptional regulator [Comamonas testosteroni]
MGSIDKRDNTPQLLNRLRMRQVALILAIDERQTLRAAAAELGLTQPAATKMLQELEDALGQPLFERVGRRLQRNAAGERVLEYFRSLRGNIEALNRELGELRQGSSGRLAVGSIMAASPGRLTQALLELKRQLPLLELEVAVDTSDRLLAQLREGVLEVVVGRMTNEAGSDCRFCPIDDEQLAFIVREEHPLLSLQRPSLQALQGHGWVMQPPGSPMRALIEQEFREHSLPLPRGLIETGSILTTINLVRSSNMVGVIPRTVADLHAAHRMLQILPYQTRRSLEAYGSLVRKDRPISRSAQMFLDLLHRHDAAA